MVLIVHRVNSGPPPLLPPPGLSRPYVHRGPELDYYLLHVYILLSLSSIEESELNGDVGGSQNKEKSLSSIEESEP